MAKRKRERRSLSRPSGRLRYRKLFLVAVEGAKTEPAYFSQLNAVVSAVGGAVGSGSPQATVLVRCIRGTDDSSPADVLQRMQKHIREEAVRPSDDAWLVVDRDEWSDTQLDELHKWSAQKDNYGFALSNPRFEFWLLLHFEDGKGVSARRLDGCLRKHIPDYDKSLRGFVLTREMAEAAVERARRKDTPRCARWPQKTGTTVYRLVERILNAGRPDVPT